MRYLTYLSLVFAFGCSQPKKQESENVSIESTQTIAFGSCSRQEKREAQLWKEVMTENPDLWIWLGDNIYADTEDMEKMKADYDLQKSHPDYQTLLQKTDVIGVWDDHDFGGNDLGKEYPMKAESRDLLFDFLDLDIGNEAWNRKGAYQSYTYPVSNRKLKIILLDVRYFRDPLEWTRDPKMAQINENGDILGEDQWKWLEKEISDDETDLFIVGSGIQVLSKDHTFEKWANFPKARARLLELVSEKVDVPLVFISGDRHISEVSKLELEDYKFPLYDITSSSLTSPWGEQSPDPNDLRIGQITYPVNFAVMNVLWNNPQPSIKIKFVGKRNEVLQEFSVDY